MHDEEQEQEQEEQEAEEQEQEEEEQEDEEEEEEDGEGGPGLLGARGRHLPNTSKVVIRGSLSKMSAVPLPWCTSRSTTRIESSLYDKWPKGRVGTFRGQG